MSYTILPRQTVDRARHPLLGEGRAIYRNGPAVFEPDTGDPVPMRSIDCGGFRSGPPRYGYIVAVTSTGERIELDTTDRASGDGHYRRWHPVHGAGWLVAIGDSSWSKGGPTDRWEGDNGTVIPMRVCALRVGKPSDWTKGGDLKKGTPAENHNWFTYDLDTGEVFVFRCASPDDLPVATEPAASITTRSRGKRHAAPRSGWPDPNAPRSSVDSFIKES